MVVGPTGGSAAATSQLNTNKDAGARFSQDMDDFLKIFVTQLNNQDPLEPFESSEFVNQMANMSGVEQAINTNKKLDTIISKTGSQDNTAVVSFIGKDVEVDSQAIMLEDGKDVSFSYKLSGALPKDTYITVKDLDGNTVFTGKGTVLTDRNNVKWDGTNNEGEELPLGIYEVYVHADYGDGKSPTSVPTLVRGKVQGVNLEAEPPTVIVNGAEIPFEEIGFIGDLS